MGDARGPGRDVDVRAALHHVAQIAACPCRADTTDRDVDVGDEHGPGLHDGSHVAAGLRDGEGPLVAGRLEALAAHEPVPGGKCEPLTGQVGQQTPEDRDRAAVLPRGRDRECRGEGRDVRRDQELRGQQGLQVVGDRVAEARLGDCDGGRRDHVELHGPRRRVPGGVRGGEEHRMVSGRRRLRGGSLNRRAAVEHPGRRDDAGQGVGGGHAHGGRRGERGRP